MSTSLKVALIYFGISLVALIVDMVWWKQIELFNTDKNNPYRHLCWIMCIFIAGMVVIDMCFPFIRQYVYDGVHGKKGDM